MMRPPRPALRGLTLIELLAALVILSSVAAAGASILRDAAGAARRAEVQGAAIAALDRWSAEALLDGAIEKSEWTFRDEAGRDWRVRVEPGERAGPPRGAEEAGFDPERLDAAWSTVFVELVTPTGRPDVALTRCRLAGRPAEIEAAPEGAR